MTAPAGETQRGYALVAAVVAMAVCAMAALAIAQSSRVAIIGGEGEWSRAQAEAAADAGFAIALHHLAALDETALQAIDGLPRTIQLDGATITMRMIDERGKIALNHAEDKTIDRMLEQAGLSGERLNSARDSLLDWLDDDDQPRAHGAEAGDYTGTAIAPRNASLLSIDELARVRGFTPSLIDRLRPFVTVDPDAQPFDPHHAQPQALAAMTPDADLSPDVIQRAREQAGQQVALTSGNPKDLLHRPVTIAVDAQVPGGHAHHETVVILSSKADQPWDIHATN